MADAESVTEWIVQLKECDHSASQRLWERYVARLVQLSRKKLGDAPRRAGDENDVVQSVFAGFFRGVREGRFPQLDDRDDLWQVLVMLVDRKSVDHRRYRLAARRGGGAVRGESAFAGGLSQVIDGAPTAGFVAQCDEQIDQLLASLECDTLRRIAILKMEGYSAPEIANELDLSLRSIERKLGVIRRTWLEAVP